MKSTFLQAKELMYKRQRDSEINTANIQFSDEEYQLRLKKKGKPRWKPFLVPSIIVGAVLGIVLIFSMGFGGLLLGLFLGLLVGFGLIILKIVLTNNYNKNIDEQIAARRSYYDQSINTSKLTFQNNVDNATAQYQNAVNTAMQKYGGSLTIGPLVEWMTSHFEQIIRAADRGSYLGDITADMKYVVETDGVSIIKELPHSHEEEREIFDFYKNNILPINEFYSKVGCAQALSKQIEFQIKKVFPTDPISPLKGASPSIIILAQDDATITLRYWVKNPNFKPAQAL